MVSNRKTPMKAAIQIDNKSGDGIPNHPLFERRSGFIRPDIL
jgi:hypothetical protein